MFFVSLVPEPCFSHEVLTLGIAVLPFTVYFKDITLHTVWFAVFNSVDCRQFLSFMYFLRIEYRWKGGAPVFCVCVYVTRLLSPVSLKETMPWHKCPLQLNKDCTGVHFEYMDLFCCMIQTYLSSESSEAGTYLIEKTWVSTWESMMMHSLKVICFS